MNRFITFVVMLIFWVLWSGMFDFFHLTLGVISAYIVVRWTGHLFVEQSKSLGQRFSEWIRFEKYTFWLLWQIVLANVEVFKLAFHPNVLSVLNPSYKTFQTKVTGDVPLFILAQSITLTPGTVTLGINKGEFIVHAINDAAAQGVPGQMEQRVLSIYKKDNHG